MTKRGCAVLMFLVTAVFTVLFWLATPAISIGYFGSVIFIEIYLLIMISLIVEFVKHGDLEDFAKAAATVFILFFVIDIIGLIANCSIFHAGALYTQLGNGNASNIQEIDYDNMVKQIDTSQIAIVDYDTAKNLADKKLGEEGALGSRVKLGKGAKMEVNGEILWVFPLEHTGFFKWMHNNSTPGYITVSASNTSKVKMYSNYSNMYMLSSYWGHNLERHLRFNGCLTTGLTEYTYELDDEYNPYWVVTTFKNTTVWTNPEATGVAICNAQTGEIKKYALNEVPDWVDVVQPDEFIARQINNYGKYVHGWFNPSDEDKTKKTDGILTVYSDSDCYYFTGMTSVGGDESTIGFIMVNTRNKKAYFSRLGGCTEDAAMGRANTLWANYGYYSVEPMPINLNGAPTYAHAMKSENSGLIVAYAMVNIKDITICAKGDTLNEAARAYAKQLSIAGMGYAASDTAYSYDLQGTVWRISEEVQDGSSFYTFMVVEDDKLFTCGYSISDELAITREGDTISISFIDDGNGAYTVTSFDNIHFGTPISENQQRRDELDAGSNEENDVLKVDPEKNADWWNSLTPEEQAEIMSGEDK